jgi:hypothetical protein
MYSPADDSHGFRQASDSNVCFNRLKGSDPHHIFGQTVNTLAAYGKGGQKAPDGCTWKSSGCCFLDGSLYLVVARHRYGEESGDPFRRQTAQNASIIRSNDLGLTWTRSEHANYDEPMFPGRRFATPYFIDYGVRGAIADASDRYIYALSNNGFWDCGDDFILARIPRARLPFLKSSDWEYYAGTNWMGKQAWSRASGEAHPVIAANGKCGMTGAAYLASKRRYVLINWYYPAGGGKMPGAATHTMWDFLEAPHPWGPWKAIGSFDSRPNGFYSPQICGLFQSPDRVFAATAGNWNDPASYRLTFVPLSIS